MAVLRSEKGLAELRFIFERARQSVNGKAAKARRLLPARTHTFTYIPTHTHTTLAQILLSLPPLSHLTLCTNLRQRIDALSHILMRETSVNLLPLLSQGTSLCLYPPSLSTALVYYTPYQNIERYARVHRLCSDILLPILNPVLKGLHFRRVYGTTGHTHGKYTSIERSMNTVLQWLQIEEHVHFSNAVTAPDICDRPMSLTDAPRLPSEDVIDDGERIWRYLRNDK